MENYIVGDFNMTGGNTVDVDLVCKDWSHLWLISRWHDEYKLYRMVRKDSPMHKLRITISPEQAKEIIKRLNLIEFQSQTFRNASTFKLPITN